MGEEKTPDVTKEQADEILSAAAEPQNIEAQLEPESPPEPPSQLDIERQILTNSLPEVRAQYGVAKLHYELAKVGAFENVHAEQKKKELKRARAGLEVIERLYAEGQGIPDLGELEVVGGELEMATELPQPPRRRRRKPSGDAA